MSRTETTRAALLLLAMATAAGTGLAAESYDRAIRFEAEDGVVINGVLMIPDAAIEKDHPAPAAMLLHGYGRDRDSLLPLADALLDAGIAAALIDMRGHGGSRLKSNRTIYVFPAVPSEEFSRAESDARILLDDILRTDEIDPTRIGVVGVGEGALVGAAVAARRPEIKALVMVDTAEEEAILRPRRSLGIVGMRPALLVCSSAPASRARAEALAGYGLGERAVACVDSFEPRARLLQPDAPATTEVVRWLSSRLSDAAR